MSVDTRVPKERCRKCKSNAWLPDGRCVTNCCTKWKCAQCGSMKLVADFDDEEV